jgi:cobalt-zinc-cadmium resistance protein CzcA
MLDKIIAFSIKNKFIIALMTLALIVWGVWSASKLPIDAVPDITNNQVQIITVCPTLAGQEVEQLVTYPIEQSIANLPDLEELRSISRFGLSVITVVFHDKVDIYFARQLINERLKEAESKIPKGVGTPELAPVSTGLGEVYQYIIHPKKGSESKYTAMDLRTMQDWIVARQLYGTPGIAEVNSFGGRLKQYEVAVNPDRLIAMGITIPEIFTALEKNNENTGGAYIDKKPNAYFIRGVGLIGSFDDIKNIVVKTNPNGIPILIKDVAEVHLGSAVRYGAMTYNGEVDAVGGVVMMLKGANSADVVSRIKDKMHTIQKSLPQDVIIEPYLDRTDLVNRAISTVEKNLIEGALIVIFVLVLFLGNLRAGLIVASAIPLSMLFALGLMNVFGVSANLMSLGAIDFGLIVDGAVIIVEASLYFLEHRKETHALSQMEMDKAVGSSAKRMMNSAAFGQIIIMIVYLPILSLIGIEGKMFRPMAQVVSFAIIGAMFLSLSYIPMMSALILPRNISHKKTFSDRMMNFFQSIYAPLLETAIRFKKVFVGATVAVFIISVFLFSKMGGEFIPTLQEGDFAFHCILPQGTSLSQSLETSMQASRLIKAFDEVKMVVGKTGAAEVPTDPMPPEATDMMIILKSPDKWKRDISYDELAEEFEEQLNTIPGVFFEKNQPIQMRFNELMTGIRQDVAVKIFGENMDTLLTYANKVNSVVQGVDGATEPSVERVAGLPQIVIKYNRSQIANYGLNIEDINHIVSTAFAGGGAGVVYENERKFDLVVRLDSTHRNNIDDVSHLYIPTANGTQIPLSQVADIKMELGPAQISREDGKRRIVIGFNIKGRDVASVVADIQTQLDENVKLPEGYYYTYGGTFENLQAASKRLMIALPVALALIFMLLYFTFSSVKQATLIYTAIPMSAIGGVFALLIRDMPFSISAGIGFIALFGVAVLNGIVLIGTFNQLEKEGMTGILERIKEGTKIRLRPVLMTATVASLGFFPMAFSHGAGAEVQKPLATVVIGGLITATFLTLFVLPLLYILFSKTRKHGLSGAEGMKPTILTTIVLLMFVFSGNVTAQTSTTPIQLTVEDAIGIAFKNNPGLQATRMEVQQNKALQKTGWEIDRTNFSLIQDPTSGGNIDNSFGITQSFSFPTVYSSQSKILTQQTALSEKLSAVTQNELIRDVKIAYYNLAYFIEKLKLLTYQDSIYKIFSNAAELRFKTGETSNLEKLSAQNKYQEIRLLKQQTEADRNIAMLELQKLLNTTDALGFSDIKLTKLPFTLNPDTALVKQNPVYGFYEQQINLAKYQLRYEKNKLLPDFTIGYYHQYLLSSFNPADINRNYFPGTRVAGIQFGISAPVFFNAQSGRIQSSQFRVMTAQKAWQNTVNNLKTAYSRQIQEYQKFAALLNYYENTGLNQADEQLKVTQLSYSKGAISYVEYIQNLTQAISIKSEYLNNLNLYNQSIININFLVNK